MMNQSDPSDTTSTELFCFLSSVEDKPSNVSLPVVWTVTLLELESVFFIENLRAAFPAAVGNVMNLFPPVASTNTDS